MKGFFSPYTGEADDELFLSWMETGELELERALAGDVANTGVDEVRFCDYSEFILLYLPFRKETHLLLDHMMHCGGVYVILYCLVTVVG